MLSKNILKISRENPKNEGGLTNVNGSNHGSSVDPAQNWCDSQSGNRFP